MTPVFIGREMWARTVAGQWRDVEITIYEPRTEAFRGASAAGTLISDLQLPQLWEKRFVLVKAPSLWYFVCQPQPTWTTAYGIIKNFYFISQATVAFSREGGALGRGLSFRTTEFVVIQRMDQKREMTGAMETSWGVFAMARIWSSRREGKRRIRNGEKAPSQDHWDSVMF